jgi:MFS family permease
VSTGANSTEAGTVERIPPPSSDQGGMFGVLRERNYRRFVIGQMLSMIGTWMQRVAQDWLVLELSGKSPLALGIATALQFVPFLFLSLWAGVLADRLDKRTALVVLQTSMGICALALGILDVSGAIQLWHVYLFCVVLGCLSAMDAPIFESFVVELVGIDKVASAVPVNSMNFNMARIIGPVIAGPAIAWIGTGWVFLANAVSFAAVIAGLLLTNPRTLHRSTPLQRTPGLLAKGLTYVRGRPDLMMLMAVVLTVSTFVNFSTSLAVATTQVFHSGAEAYGFLSTMLAVGMLTGAALATKRSTKEHPRLWMVFASALMLGGLETTLGLMPTTWLFGLLLVATGAALTLFVTTAHSTVQLSVIPEMRGRVMGLYMLVLVGGAPIGGPLNGWLADVFGGRAPFVAGGVLSMLVAASCWLVLVRGQGSAPSKVLTSATPPIPIDHTKQ